MKKFVVLILICMICYMPNVKATGGSLRKNTIKTCPNGVTYGLHSDGHGGTHWHVALTNGKSYYASGDAILSDPCPGHTQNNGTANSTSGSSTSNSSKSNTSTNVTPAPAPKTETPVAKPVPVEPAKPVEDKKEEVIENKEEKKVEETDTLEEKEEVKEELPKSTSDKKEYDVTPTKEVDYSNYNYQVDSSRETTTLFRSNLKIFII